MLVLDNLVSADECEALRSEACECACEERESQTRSSAKYGASVPARVRLPIADHLAAEEVELCDRILMRSVAVLTEQLPELLADRFGATLDGGTVLGNARLGFSDGEPAVNVYTAGGYFKPHEDKQAITVLVPLNDAAAGSFVGGGTGFWSASDKGAPPAQMPWLSSDYAVPSKPPTLVVHAARGAALCFTGRVTHSGLAVVSGERALLVASWSPEGWDR